MYCLILRFDSENYFYKFAAELLVICREICGEDKILYFCSRVSPVRPAPAESPQGRKAARVGGRSGATQVAYPLFMVQ